MRAIMIAVTAAAALLASGASLRAQDGAQVRATDVPASPPAYDAVVACEAVTESTARLACFDRTVAALGAAIRDKKVVVLDSATVREARRGIFGLRLPRLKLFDDDDDGEEVVSIDSTITAVRRAADGFPIFVLEDGARWKQTVGRTIMAKPGHPVHIKRAAMGSFMANVNRQPAIRVVRLGD